MSAGINSRGDALAERARMLIQLRRAPEAEREARTALAEDPENAAGHILLAVTLFLQEDMDRALTAANRGIGLIPHHWVGHWVAALILAQTGRHREALVALQHALARDPDEPALYEWLARINLGVGDLHAAAGAAEQGLRLAPEDVDLAEVMALTLAQLGDNDGARVHASLAVRLAPESPAGHRAYGLVMLATGDHTAAASAFRELLRLAPDHEDGLVLLLAALRRRNPLHRLDDFLNSLRLVPRRSVVQWLAVVWFPPCAVVTILLTLATWVSWVAQSVTTLLTCRDPADRRLLDAAEVRAAWITGGLLSGGLVLLALAAAFDSPGTVMAGVAMWALITPVQETALLGGTRRTVFGACTTTLALAQAVMIPLSYFGILSLVPSLLTVYASLVSTWAGNLLYPRAKTGTVQAPATGST